MSSEQTLKPGDVVRLKSGGPRMTVDWIDTDGHEIICTWFKGDERHRDRFGWNSLQLVED